MDMRNSRSKKYLFKTRKRGEVDVERVAFEVSAYRSKSQLENLGFFSRVKGAKDPKTTSAVWLLYSPVVECL